MTLQQYQQQYPDATRCRATLTTPGNPVGQEALKRLLDPNDEAKVLFYEAKKTVEIIIISRMAKDQPAQTTTP